MEKKIDRQLSLEMKLENYWNKLMANSICRMKKIAKKKKKSEKIKEINEIKFKSTREYQ